jgi:Fungal Zn(2)-Cys(6) binuclear cluster domain
MLTISPHQFFRHFPYMRYKRKKQEKKSCEPCRQRKSKCDSSTPCSSCILHSTKERCRPTTSSHQSRIIYSLTQRDESIGEKSINTISPPSIIDPEQRVHGHIPDIRDSLKQIDLKLKAYENLEIDQSLQDLPQHVQWKEVHHLFPIFKDLDVIIQYFISDLAWISASFDIITFQRSFHNLNKSQSSSKLFIALLFFVVGNSLSLAKHNGNINKITISQSPEVFIKRGGKVLFSDSPFEAHKPDMASLEAHILLCYYLSRDGRPEALRNQVGKLIIDSNSCHLFDETKWDTTKLSQRDIELRRRMVHDVKLLESRCSFHFLQHFLPNLIINVNEPSYYDVECFDQAANDLYTFSHAAAISYHRANTYVIRGSNTVTENVLNFTSMTSEARYSLAKKIVEDLEQLQQMAFSLLDDEHQTETTFQRLLIRSAFQRQKCVVQRQFLFDANAPMELRAGALKSAEMITGLINEIISIQEEGKIAMFTSWFSCDLFCAICTFVLLMQHKDIGEDGLTKFISDIYHYFHIFSETDRVAMASKEVILNLLINSKSIMNNVHLFSGILRNELNSSLNNGHQIFSSNNVSKDDLPGFNRTIPAGEVRHVPPSINLIAQGASTSEFEEDQNSLELNSDDSNSFLSHFLDYNNIFTSIEQGDGGALFDPMDTYWNFLIDNDPSLRNILP